MMSHLHALVITAFHLAQSGVDDEDLFGILACVCQMLTVGANPGTKCDISLELLDIKVSDNMDMCNHEAFTPAELAQRIGSHNMAYWPENVITGWKILCWVLSRSQNSWAPGDRAVNRDVDQDCYDQDEYDHPGHFGKDPTLGTLWASVQTELLTYRRVNVGDSWVSANFDMERLLWGLKTKEKVTVGLVEKGLMKDHCGCGRFSSHAPCMSEVSATYISNMDIWERATYLSCVEL